MADDDDDNDDVLDDDDDEVLNELAAAVCEAVDGVILDHLVGCGPNQLRRRMFVLSACLVTASFEIMHRACGKEMAASLITAHLDRQLKKGRYQ